MNLLDRLHRKRERRRLARRWPLLARVRPSLLLDIGDMVSATRIDELRSLVDLPPCHPNEIVGPIWRETLLAISDDYDTVTADMWNAVASYALARQHPNSIRQSALRADALRAQRQP